MTPAYIARVVEPTGLTPHKWEEARRHCRALARERRMDVTKVYAEWDLLTPREYENLIDDALERRRKQWRERKRRAKRARQMQSDQHPLPALRVNT